MARKTGAVDPERLVPAVTSAEMTAVDQAIVEDYGIDLIQMMENAGISGILLIQSASGRSKGVTQRGAPREEDPPGPSSMQLN